MHERSVHVVISGRVQGVGYRAWVAREANRLGISGWARNRIEGTVEAVFTGPRDKVDYLIVECATGPAWAKVADVSVISEAAPASGIFRILPTE